MASTTNAKNMAYKANHTKLSKHNKFTIKKSPEKKFKESRKKHKKKYRAIAARDSVRTSVIAEKLEDQLQFLQDEEEDWFEFMNMNFYFHGWSYDRYVTC